MRMMPSRYTSGAKPMLVKRAGSAVRHLSAPLKGMSLSTALSQGDPMTAPILDNWVIEEGSITCRPGCRLVTRLAGDQAVWSMPPFHGVPHSLAVASASALYDMSGREISSGFTSGDWHWTAFSNLSAQDYTILVNGKDGVWSWTGGADAPVKEEVTAPADKGYIVPDAFGVVLAHMNRLWFADSTNLSVYYLPLQQKAGEVKELPLNALFRRGGQVRALGTWTVEGGVGLDDHLVIFSSNGEAVIYNGTDPDADFSLAGIYRFDSPMSKHCILQYGGELYTLCSTGLIPMSRLMRSEDEQLGKYDRNVFSAFEPVARSQRGTFGWSVLLDTSTGRAICNLPLGKENAFRQMVRFMPNPVWASWSGLSARCWGWLGNRLFFGTDDGRIMEMHPAYLSDNGEPIRVDVQGAWSSFGTPAVKQFKMVRPQIRTDGTPHPSIDIRCDYDTSPPSNQPDAATVGASGEHWDEAEWDVAPWAGGETVQQQWTGVTGIGTVAAPRLTAMISNCHFSLVGWDVLYEAGSVFG